MSPERKKYAVFTVDVEALSDTECVCNSGARVQTDMLDGLDEYIRILDKYNIKATMFTVCRTALNAKVRIASHISNGHRLALHSLDHTTPDLQSNGKFREDTLLAKRLLSETFGTEIHGYRAPCFAIDNEKLDILKELGFLYDSSHIDFPHARHTRPVDLKSFQPLRKGIFRRQDFYEFGLVHHRVFGQDFPISGGGYVRMFNWNIIKSAILDYIRKNDYYVFYLHPFELSRKRMPFIPNLKLHDKIYLNYGVQSFAYKVERIIQLLKQTGYSFVTFEELAGILDHSGNPAKNEP